MSKKKYDQPSDTVKRLVGLIHESDLTLGDIRRKAGYEFSSFKNVIKGITPNPGVVFVENVAQAIGYRIVFEKLEIPAETRG